MFKTETFIINYEEDRNLKVLRYRKLSRKRFLHYKQIDLAVKSLEKFSQGADIKEWHDYIFTSLCLSNVVTDRRL